MKNMKSILNAISLFTLVLCGFLTVHLLYLTYYPIKILELVKFETEQKVVKRGETLAYHLDFKKFKPYRAEIKYFLVDGIIIRLEDGGTYRVPGTHEVKNERVIPTTVLPGVYRYRVEIRYVLTPWRDVLYTWESNEFQVK